MYIPLYVIPYSTKKVLYGIILLYLMRRINTMNITNDMDRASLYSLLQEIAPNLYELKDGNYDDLALSMFKYIGDKDPVLRDELIYAGYICLADKNKLSKNTLRELFFKAQDDKHLFFQLGNKNDSDVVTRSFSTLLLVILLEVNKALRFLNDDEVYTFALRFLEYYEKESNLIGYDDSLGWCHAIAHGADMLETLTSYQLLNNVELLKILELFKKKVLIGDYVYIDGELNRMMPAITNILSQGLFDITQFEDWLDSFKNPIIDRGLIDYYHLEINKKNFFMELYFAMEEAEIPKEFCGAAYMHVIS